LLLAACRSPVQLPAAGSECTGACGGAAGSTDSAPPPTDPTSPAAPAPFGGAPITIAGGQVQPTALALGPDDVYWVDAGADAIVHAPKGGGAPATLVAQAHVSDRSGIAVAGARLYWASQDGVMSMGLTGGDPSVFATDADYRPEQIAVDGDAVYWTGALRTGGFKMHVMRASLTGGGDLELAAVTPSPGVILSIVGSDLYFTSLNALFRLPKTGGEAVVVTNEPDGVPGFAADASYGYLAGADTVVRMTWSDRKALVLASGQQQPGAIVLDAATVFFTTFTDGTIKAVQPGAKPVTLASNQQRPVGLTMDATGLYWANLGGGTIMKIAR
jgi:hypothetical protein